MRDRPAPVPGLAGRPVLRSTGDGPQRRRVLLSRLCGGDGRYKGNRPGECFRQSGVCTKVQIVDRSDAKQEARMIKSVIRLVTLTMFSLALIAAPSPAPVLAAGGGGDPP